MASKSISEESLPLARYKKVSSNTVIYSHRIERKIHTSAYTRPQGRSQEKYTASQKRDEMVNVAASSDHALGRRKEREQGVLLVVGQVEDKMAANQSGTHAGAHTPSP